MKRLLITYIAFFAFFPGLHNAEAQDLGFRGTSARLSAGVGVFTYHGPTNLLAPDSPSNHVHRSDAAVALLGSFPLLADRIYFRFMLLATNFDTASGRETVGNGENQFLTENLLLFEPTVVFTIPGLSSGSFVPYLFTGFGGTLADPFGGRLDIVDMPGTGVPGPEKSAFHIPLGIGFDLALSDRVSLFGEASGRLDMNYVLRNEDNFDEHSTTLLMGGVRTRLGRTKAVDPVIPPIPPVSVSIPDCHSGGCTPPASLSSCQLADFTPIFFEGNSVELTQKEREVLDQNVVAFFLERDCCAAVIGHAVASDPVESVRLADRRSRVVHDYLVEHGVSASRFRLSVVAVPNLKCSTKAGMASCPEAAMVEIDALDCTQIADPE
jgi:hypothetical protein